MKNKFLFYITILLFFSTTCAYAQQFGRNKPIYKKFKYKVVKTPSFEIYHYLKNDSLINSLVSLSEEWHTYHQQIFKDTLSENPIIFYSNHADFQQTTAISGSIGVGTGGVTEAFRGRVVLPVTESYAQTNHVLGHELVHAFQFHKIINGDSTSLRSLQNFPLWMIEGMAEYLSIGSKHAQTAMWLRDALLQEEFPSLKKMSHDYKYNPYRFGHAFWAFIAKTWGDDKILPIFEETGKYGYKKALKDVIGIEADSISDLWKNSVIAYYSKYLPRKKDEHTGKKLIFEDNAGRMNIAPVLSPNGKYIVFISEKNLFSQDIFLAETSTGKIIKKLWSLVNNSEVDDLNFLESSGTWSPDSKRFAFVTIRKGKNQLSILDVKKAKVVKEINISGISSFKNPAWSPDGKQIVVSGLVEGINDLYLFHFDTKKVINLTNNHYANLHPYWSWDGKKIAFSTDMPKNGSGKVSETFQIASIDINTKEIEHIPVFSGANNVNPLFSKDNKSIYFLSDADGYRNLFRYSFEDKNTYRLTNFMTGITGITPLAPAISISEKKQLAYTFYSNWGYNIYLSDIKDFKEELVSDEIINDEAAIIPPLYRNSKNIVDNALTNRPAENKTAVESIKHQPYRSKFKLDYIGSTQVGVSTNRFGTGMAGSIEALFSDVVGKHQLYTNFSLNGEIYDFGGLFAYVNKENRINWGGSLSHIPYLRGYYGSEPATIDGIQALNRFTILQRTFEEKLSGFAFFPISKTRRFEAGISMMMYHYRIDKFSNYYQGYGYLGSSREKINSPSGFWLQQVDVAYVSDNSYFGLASPLNGHRMRIGINKYLGEISMTSITADYRKYFFLKPISLGFRAYHVGRYVSKKNRDFHTQTFLGYPWLIRGYEYSSFSNTSNVYEGNQIVEYNELDFEQIFGDKVIVVNFEVRIPFIGPERLALIKANSFYSEINFFFDGGLAWNEDNASEVVFKWLPNNAIERTPVFSAGVSMRVNLFGAIILEPYYAIPFQRNNDKTGVFGLNFMPGW